jgi:hypothetical protein
VIGILRPTAPVEALAYAFSIGLPSDEAQLDSVGLRKRVERAVGQTPVELTYSFHNQNHHGDGCGRLCFRDRKVSLSHVFAGQSVGVTRSASRIGLVTFMHYDVGYFDDETCGLEPMENPFGPKVLPLRSE